MENSMEFLTRKIRAFHGERARRPFRNPKKRR